ncbi:zinc ribbon domain-containing protein [Desulfosarcina sp.]|nr:zinc ribbon domain-containing protein [Desulfosarcina sp.]
MININFVDELDRAENYFREGSFEDSIKICTSNFELVLKKEYSEIKKFADGSDLKRIIQFEKKQKKRSNCDDVGKFTLGQMIHTFKDKFLNIYDLFDKILNKDTTITKSIDLSLINVIRKKSVHPDGENQVSKLEARFVFYVTKIILEELSYYADTRCPECDTILNGNPSYCYSCGKVFTIRCPECDQRVKKGSNICGDCGKEIYILSEAETEILKNTRQFLRKIHSRSIHCPICDSPAEVCDVVDYDEDICDYEFRCQCEYEIEYILRYSAIKNSMRYRFQQFLDSKTDIERPPGYYIDLIHAYANLPFNRYE